MTAATKARRKAVSFKVSADDARLIKAIVERARADRAELEKELRIALAPVNWRDVEMSLTACHANGTPLDLTAFLAAASNGDFAHDVWGIAGNISTRTGELLNFFHPRFARSEAA